MANVGEPMAIASANTKKTNSPASPATETPHGELRILYSIGYRILSLIHKFGQPNVQLAEAPNIVSGKRYIHLIVHIEPLRVMVHFLGYLCNACHPSKSIIKVSELKPFVYSVTAFSLGPPI